MSVYIKGMEMPGLIHGSITIRIYPKGKCYNMHSLWPRDPMKGVTAVPVPPHGRLIDADALKKNAYPFPCAIGTEWAVTLRQINDAPTIIPASGGNENE